MNHEEVDQMSIISKAMQRISRMTTKHFVVAGVFTLALAGSIGLGLSTRQSGQALTTVRECEHNSIDYKPNNGGCGAYSASEYIKDLNQNDPADLQVLAKNFTSDFHLAPSEYADFEAKAMDGIAYQNGDIKLMDGTLVATGGWSIGRDPKSYSTPFNVPGDGTTYHKSRSQDVFAINEILVMIYFDKTGTVQYVVMKPCGNLMGGAKVVSSAQCTALNSNQDQTNPNKYTFTTNATFAGNAKLQKVVYTFSDTGETVTKNSLSDVVDHTFKKAGKVTVTVYATAPGGSTITTNCEKQITYVPPMAVCTALVPTVLDNKNQKFRFTVKTATKYAEVKSVAMSLDNATAEAVTAKDNEGNYYKEYEFTDSAKHTVVATVAFTTIEGDKSANCDAKVESKKTPVCEVPGHEGQPINDQCGYCKPGIPIGDDRCKEVPPATLVNTGPGNVAGLFIGTTAAGALGHRVYKRRASKKAAAILV
jgi:hypothetical protein